MNNSKLDNDRDNDLSTVNSKYYDLKQLNTLEIDLPSSFRLFHVNIASLDNHFDNLRLIFSLLNYNFDVIGISEHKTMKDTLPVNNIKTLGYEEFKFEHTGTTHGGTGFYFEENTDYIMRKDVQINSPSDHKSIFMEIKFPNKKNLVVGCVYRHPNSNISVHNLANFLNSSENKQCILMGMLILAY